MQEREFKRALDRIGSDREFTEIDYLAIDFIYCWYPNIKDHEDIARLYDIGGMTLITDLLPHAKELSGIRQTYYEMQKKARSKNEI